MRPAEMTFRLRGWGRVGLGVFLVHEDVCAYRSCSTRQPPHGWTVRHLPDGRLRVAARRKRREWLVRRDEVILVKTTLFGTGRTMIDNGSIHVARSVDSDGDETFSLDGTSNRKPVTLLRELHDERTILRLARIIEQTSGWSVRIDYQHD